MNDVLTSVINIAGRVQWLPKDQARHLVEVKKSHRYIVNPKQTYYPQYDQNLVTGTQKITIDAEGIDQALLQVEEL